MMNKVTPFDFQGHDVRVVAIDDEPWFIAKDVAEILGYRNTRDAILNHCKCGRKLEGVANHDSPNGATIIPERDVYRLAMRSRLPAAEAFEEWVVAEVLPSIRKTGGYGEQRIDFDNPQHVAGLIDQCQGVIAHQAKILEEQKERIAKDEPKVNFYDQFANSDGLFGLQNAGRALGQRPNKFIQWLKQDHLFYQGSSLMAKAQYISQGLFETKVAVVDGTSRPQTFITPKGLQHLERKLLQHDRMQLLLN